MNRSIKHFLKFDAIAFSVIFALPKNICIVSTVDLVAQLVEHNTFNVGVLGSNPNGITKRGSRLFFYFIPEEIN